MGGWVDEWMDGLLVGWITCLPAGNRASPQGNMTRRKGTCLAAGRFAWPQGNVPRRMETCFAAGKDASPQGNMPRHTETCLAAGNRASPQGNMPRCRESCLAAGNRASPRRNMSRRRKTCLAAGKRASPHGDMARRRETCLAARTRASPPSMRQRGPNRSVQHRRARSASTAEPQPRQSNDQQVQLATNDAINELFGEQTGGTWAADQIVLSNGCKIQAFGARQSLRGAKHNDQRPDFLFVEQSL